MQTVADRLPEISTNASRTARQPTVVTESVLDGGAVAMAVDEVGYKYGERHALINVSFNVAPGEMFGLLGPNGSGKSTLFRLISTLSPMQSGTIGVFGSDVTTQQAAVREKLGVLFQQPALDKHLTVRENILFHGRLYKIKAADLNERLDLLLNRFDLTDRINDRVLRLSGGMRRKVELAKTLVTRPQLLLLDEPTVGLDVAARTELFTLLRHMRQTEGITVVLTTHLMDEADRCDRLAILNDGRLIRTGTPSSLKQSVGGSIITLTAADPTAVREKLLAELDLKSTLIDNTLRIEPTSGEPIALTGNESDAFSTNSAAPGVEPVDDTYQPREFPADNDLFEKVIAATDGLRDSITLGRPTLDDVFITLTGRTLHQPQHQTPPDPVASPNPGRPQKSH